ncbi:FAD-dependent oxidoreductase [Novispirillum sp. DQ9]|uniref:FAD-dependent oxidoreductase n=1 Tax=Novispirillum sp. DQ9 TaxID=3398612 RepID=UPI003C7B6DBE
MPSTPPLAPPLTLGHGLRFADLMERAGLERLDAAFLETLDRADAVLATQLRAARANPAAVPPAEASALMLALAPHLEDFVARLFGIAVEVAAATAAVRALDPLFEARRQFVQRHALKRYPPEVAAGFDGPALEQALGGPFTETEFAARLATWDDAALDTAARYAAWRAATRPGHALFKAPRKRDPAALVPVTPTDRGLAFAGEARERDGFALTDAGCDLAGGLGEAHYCILCHHQGFDSCSKGLHDRKSGVLQVNPHGRVMRGCPLDEKISEMHEAKRAGLTIAALAIVVVDNPLCAATGHRICNDCMVACIYQNQSRDPVDIPQAETRVLKDVLALPWGVEIYGLLTRWNPLNLTRPLPLPDSGRKVLVVGAGPAGLTLAHHLLNDGHTVALIDGLKIEPLDPALRTSPVFEAASLWQPLDSRPSGGVGGVAEYGITVRWDKNFLTVIRLLLERRAGFALFGGVRYGGTLTEDMAFTMGFDHVALCMGAGRPTLIAMDNGLAKGVRQASDFLMTLQLTGAARRDSVANLHLRLPVAVIGGGLTAIDAATEALAYYPVQVERFLDRHEVLAAERGEAAVRARWTAEEAEIAEEFLAHGRAVRAERALARQEGRAPRLRALCDAWGGVRVVYRRGLTDSPAYRNNPEEVHKALEEGITFTEHRAPARIVVDRWGAAAVLWTTSPDGGEEAIPARAVIVAAGTVPNVSLAGEQPGVALDHGFFQAVDDSGAPVRPERSPKPAEAQVLRAVRPDGGAVSFFGDQHPGFAGSVVSAMASAKRGAPVVTRLLMARPPRRVSGPALLARLEDALRPTVAAVTRLAPEIVEVVVRAPLAARMFEPGQFYRLHNFEARAARVPGATLAMEGLALTGAWTDIAQGLVGLIVLEMGGSSDLCALLEPGEPVVLMGPTGAPTEILADRTVLLAGGGLGNAVLFSIGRALREAGSRVLYFAGYRAPTGRFKVEDIEAAADVVVWCCDVAPGFTPGRPQDKAVVGTIVEAMAAYGRGDLGPADIPLAEVDHIIAIGSDGMMGAVARARRGLLAPFLKPEATGVASVNSPMQCMMKEICAQCLQPQRDPVTGETRVVFTCSNQDQPLEAVDYVALRARLSLNGLPEKQTALWIDRALRTLGRR